MSGALGTPADSAGFSGYLSESPLFVVLRRIQRERLSGTLSIFREEQVRQFFFENGSLHAARSSREDHRIGATLVRWGYISEADLQEALELQRQSHERIDQILIAKGLVTRAVVDSEARRQMEQIVFSTLSWSSGAFHFEADTGPLDLDVAVSLSEELIIEGIRRIPESEQFVELLGDLSGVPVLKPDAGTTGSFRMLKQAFAVLERIDGKTDLKTMLNSEPSGSATAKILYSLLFSGLMEILPTDPSSAGEAERPAPAPTARHAEPPATHETGFAAVEPRGSGKFPAPAGIPAKPAEEFDTVRARRAPAILTDRQIVLDTYRQLDWLSHYDLLGVSRRATPQQIEEAYRSRARLFDPSLKSHPELVDLWRQLTVLAKWLKIAYTVLSNPLTREAYDRKIDESTPG